jgi:hypothetical protein
MSSDISETVILSCIRHGIPVTLSSSDISETVILSCIRHGKFHNKTIDIYKFENCTADLKSYGLRLKNIIDFDVSME